MKKKKYKLIISSDNEHVLKCFHSWMVNDAEQLCLISDEETGMKVFYPEIKWNLKDNKDLNLEINCDFENEYQH